MYTYVGKTAGGWVGRSMFYLPKESKINIPILQQLCAFCGFTVDFLLCLYSVQGSHGNVKWYKCKDGKKKPNWNEKYVLKKYKTSLLYIIKTEKYY